MVGKRSYLARWGYLLFARGQGGPLKLYGHPGTVGWPYRILRSQHSTNIVAGPYRI